LAGVLVIISSFFMLLHCSQVFPDKEQAKDVLAFLRKIVDLEVLITGGLRNILLRNGCCKVSWQELIFFVF
jgi:hypothetical protein